MYSLWIWVALLFALFLGVQWRYAWRDKANAEQRWRQVDRILRQRHAFIADTIRRMNTPAPQSDTVERALEQIGARSDIKFKQLKQRCALEFRLATESRKLFELNPPDAEQIARLAKLDRDIQGALAMYDIAERSYNRRLEGFPGAMIGVLPGFSRAPALDIEPVLPPYDSITGNHRTHRKHRKGDDRQPTD